MAKFVPYESNRAFFEPTKETLNSLEQVIRWAESEVPSQLKKWMNELAFMMALVNQGLARKMSYGPYDPSASNVSHQLIGRRFIGAVSGPSTPEPIYKTSSPLAWKIPVRRITEAYYLGWKVRSRGNAVWQLYNDSREAYFIEFGINWRGAGRRVRRPVRKLTLRQTLDYMMSTQSYHRIWADIFAKPGASRGVGFYQIVQSPGFNPASMMPKTGNIGEILS